MIGVTFQHRHNEDKPFEGVESEDSAKSGVEF